MIKRYHLQEMKIPDGFQIYEERLSVMGVQFHKRKAITFAHGGTIWIELQRENKNPYDKNAIKIIGCIKWWWWIRHLHIGYVQKEVSARIVEGGFLGQVKPRLLKTYVSDGGFVEVLFQIIGPKDKVGEYWSTPS